MRWESLSLRDISLACPITVRFTTLCLPMSSDDPFRYYSEDESNSPIWPLFIGIVGTPVILMGSLLVYYFINYLRDRRGTYVPPTLRAPGPILVKPELWEVHLDSEGSGGGQQLGSSIGSGRGDVELNDTDCWDFFKPIYAGFAEPPILSFDGSSLNLPNSPSPPPYIPINPPAPRGDDEESQLTAEVSTTSPSESLLARERIFLNLDSTSTTVPESPTQPKIRVAVLVAMPSPTPSHRDVSTTPLSYSASSSLSSNSSQATTSQSPELLPSTTTTLRSTNDDEQPLPHLEMGVADFLVGRSTSIRDSSSWYSAHSTNNSRRKDRSRTNYSRGSSSYTESD